MNLPSDPGAGQDHAPLPIRQQAGQALAVRSAGQLATATAAEPEEFNIDLLSLPSAADLNAGATIPIVEVTVSSLATDFVLGDVNFAQSALFTADYSLVYDGSEFALGFDVTGLSSAGVLLTSLSPAIQNMWYGSLG